jgi:hypothetical protein
MMTKKVIILVCILLLIGHVLSALDMTIGIKGGANASGFYGENYPELVALISTPVFGADPWLEYMLTISYQAGVYVTLGILDFLTLQTELHYTRIGEWMENLYGGYIENMSDYLEICALVNVRFVFPEVDFNLYAGPDVIWRMADEADIIIYDEDYDKLATVTLTEDDMYRWLFRLMVGVGLNVKIDSFVLSFDVRYAAPLHKCYTDDVPFNDYGLNCFQFLVGVGYKLF